MRIFCLAIELLSPLTATILLSSVRHHECYHPPPAVVLLFRTWLQLTALGHLFSTPIRINGLLPLDPDSLYLMLFILAARVSGEMIYLLNLELVAAFPCLSWEPGRTFSDDVLLTTRDLVHEFCLAKRWSLTSTFASSTSFGRIIRWFRPILGTSLKPTPCISFKPLLWPNPAVPKFPATLGSFVLSFSCYS